MENIKILNMMNRELKYAIKKENKLCGLYKNQELPDEKDLFDDNWNKLDDSYKQIED